VRPSVNNLFGTHDKGEVDASIGDV
jgi:hypothetical protein